MEVTCKGANESIARTPKSVDIREERGRSLEPLLIPVAVPTCLQCMLPCRGAPTRNDFDERRDGLYRIASRENLEGIGVDAVGSSSGSGKGDITGERSDPDPCDVAKYCASQIVGLDEESTTSNMSSDCSGDCGMHGIDNYMMDSGEELGDGTWPDGGGVRRGGGRCVRRLRERIASSGHSHPSIVCPCPVNGTTMIEVGRGVRKATRAALFCAAPRKL